MASIVNEVKKHAKTVLMLGCFDTKGEDFAYLYSCLVELGIKVLTLNTGVFETNVNFPIDIATTKVFRAARTELRVLRSINDRGLVIEKMGEGAAKIIAQLYAAGKIDGVISMGGGGGTYIALSAMQSLPVGIPKLCLSTIAAKDLSRQVGTKDIVLMPSIVDVAGLNKISRTLIRQAAGAIVGMINAAVPKEENAKGTIAISIFGNTTPCVEKCTALLKEKGYEVLSFHAVGTGGKTMESLIREGFFDGVLDITTTELADELCNGICSAGADRLTAASEMGISQIVVPGCLDMVNYGHLDTVPKRNQGRLLYSWAPDVTLMRTNEEENSILGKVIARKLNKAKGKTNVLIPLNGISIVSSKGEVFYAPEIDQVLFDTIKEHLNPKIPIEELQLNINDEAFAERAVEVLLEMMKASNQQSHLTAI